MTLKSIHTSSLFINYPRLRWSILNIFYPLFYLGTFIVLLFLQVVFLVQGKFIIAIIFPFIIAILIFMITYRIRKGQLSKQTLKLQNDYLVVINKLFPFIFTKKYLLKSLKIEAIEPWNMLSGNSINLSTEYAKLIINNDTKLYHLYKMEHLEVLIKKFKSKTNSN